MTHKGKLKSWNKSILDKKNSLADKILAIVEKSDDIKLQNILRKGQAYDYIESRIPQKSMTMSLEKNPQMKATLEDENNEVKTLLDAAVKRTTEATDKLKSIATHGFGMFDGRKDKQTDSKVYSNDPTMNPKMKK